LNAAHHGFVDVADRLGRSVSAKSSDAELQRPNSTLNENFRQEKLLPGGKSTESSFTINRRCNNPVTIGLPQNDNRPLRPDCELPKAHGGLIRDRLPAEDCY
jgi:hypothetical protein